MKGSLVCGQEVSVPLGDLCEGFSFFFPNIVIIQVTHVFCGAALKQDLLLPLCIKLLVLKAKHCTTVVKNHLVDIEKHLRD